MYDSDAHTLSQPRENQWRTVAKKKLLHTRGWKSVIFKAGSVSSLRAIFLKDPSWEYVPHRWLQREDLGINPLYAPGPSGKPSGPTPTFPPANVFLFWWGREGGVDLFMFIWGHHHHIFKKKVFCRDFSVKVFSRKCRRERIHLALLPIWHQHSDLNVQTEDSINQSYISRTFRTAGKEVLKELFLNYRKCVT